MRYLYGFFCLIVSTLTASLPPTSLDLNRNFGLALRPPSNATVPDLTGRHLPNDPMIFHPSDSTNYLRFSHYGRPIHKAGITFAIKAATVDLGRHQSAWMLDARVPQALNYKDIEHSVELYVVSRSLTWRQWATALELVGDFYQTWDPVTLVFEICSEKHEQMARGFVWYHGYLRL